MAAPSLPASLGSAANLNSHLKEAESKDQALKPMFNIGLYGWGLSLIGEFVKANRDLQRRFRKLGGVDWLYVQTYYGEEVSRTYTTENITTQRGCQAPTIGSRQTPTAANRQLQQAELPV